MKTIVLTGGGTGGHITPNLALIEGLKAYYDEIHYIGGKEGMERELTKNSGAIYHGVECAKLIRAFSLKNLTLPFALWRGVREAKGIIKEIQPSVIFSKGGFVSLPACLGKGKAPLVIHESDHSLGLANRLVKGKADKILSAFEIEGATRVGAPLRKGIYFGDKERARRACGFSRHLPTLLITGGSSGARAINEIVDKALPYLTKSFNIIHLCGRGNGETVGDGYARFEFCERMADLYALCDYAISRGGANTIFELLALKKPTVIIPLPKGVSRGDQEENGEYFRSKGAIEVLAQKDLSVTALLSSLDTLRKNSIKIKGAIGNLGLIDGREEIVRILAKYAK